MQWFAQQTASMCTSISVVVLKPNQCVELSALDGRQWSSALCLLAAELGIVIDKQTSIAIDVTTLTINAVWPAWHVNMHTHPARVACLGMPCTLLCSVSVAGGSLWEAVEEWTAHSHCAGKKLHQSHQAGLQIEVVLTQPLQLNRFPFTSCLAS